MQKRRILIVDSNDELRGLLDDVLSELGHEVVALSNAETATARDDFDRFDLVISDLSDDGASGGVQILSELNRQQVMIPVVVASEEKQQPGIVKAFRMGAANFVRRPFERDELQAIVDKTLSYKLRFVEDLKILPHVCERIEFELPSDISLMNGILHYLMERVVKLGLINPQRSNLFIALDEAFVNAVKHGNKFDHNKLVRITAELSTREARFIVEDEGEGFNPADVPDPLDPMNLFKTSGRGVLLIHNIMDEVAYSERGNCVTMIKRAEASLDSELIAGLDDRG
ncbi:MAG: ATP-binding protein [Pyrinomonadaceae bacterium MAG19_C2-C3]|nr:ATP-binding protein [Pyrinomonadaceae bacterium MAG19_C2-C3]